MAVFLGLDCGGSSCRALALDERGSALFRGQSGPANILSTPVHVLRANLCKAVAGCPEPDAVCGCFAGLIGDIERALGERLLKEMYPGAKVRALPDYCAAYTASPEGTDVCVIAGTGSVVCSRVEGKWVKTGARGYLLGNEGSAFKYGRFALIAYLKNPKWADDHGLALIGRAFGHVTESAIIETLYQDHSPAALIASMAPMFGSAVKRQDKQALAFLDDQSSRLAGQAADHLQRFHQGVECPLVSVAGGVWKLGPAFLEAFKRNLAGARQSPEVVKLRRAPVHGAAMLAMEMGE